MLILLFSTLVFFVNDPTTPEIYTLSLHDALPIPGRRLHARRRGRHARRGRHRASRYATGVIVPEPLDVWAPGDRKSTRLNSSHVRISYAVFCLKKKNMSHRAITHFSSDDIDP